MAILNNLIVNGSSRFLNTAYFQDVSIAGSAALASLSLSGTLSVTGATTLSGTLGVTGAATFGNITATGTVVFSKTQDLSGTANSSPALIVGGTATSAHMELDANEIHAKATGTTVADLYLNNQGGKVYLSGNSVYASGSTFVTPTANISTLNATNVNVTNNLRANHYDLQTVAQLGGSFYVSPTVKFPNSGTTLAVAKSGSTLTLTITDSSITSTTMAGVVWAANSRVKVSGTINGVVTGTMDGTVSSINTSSNFITLSVSGENSASVVAGSYTASQFSDLTVMIYQRRDGSNDYRVGIWMNCYDVANSSSTIRIYGGSDANPNVMLGNLTSAGLGTVNNLTPTGWGLFAQNAFLHGKVVANGGLIGNWTIGTTGMYYNSDAPSSTSITMIPGGTTASTTSIGGSSGSKQWIFTGKNLFGIDTTGKLYASSAEISGKITANSGSIAGWRIESTYLASGTATAPAANVLLLSPAGTSSSYTVAGTAKSGWMITAGTTFGVNKDGGVYANSGKIGGWTLDASSLYTGTKTETSSIIVSSADVTRTINGASRTGLRLVVGSNFGVSNTGVLYASSVDLTGKIIANTGYIGGTSGWTIASQQLSNGEIGKDNSLFLATKNLTSTTSIGARPASEGTDWRFTIGSHFGVTNTGALYAGGTDSYIWYDGSDITIKTDSLMFGSGDTIIDALSEINDTTDKINNSIQTIDNRVSGTEGDINNISNWKSNTDSLVQNNVNQISQINTTINTIQTDLADYNDLRRMYLTFDKSGGGLTIGDYNNKAFTTNITNEKLAFQQNGIDVAYIGGNEFNIHDGIIQSTLRVGNFVFAPDSDNSFGLRYSPIE